MTDLAGRAIDKKKISHPTVISRSLTLFARHGYLPIEPAKPITMVKSYL